MGLRTVKECDKCKQPIEGEHTVVTLQDHRCDLSERPFTQLVLCDDCTDELEALRDA